MGRVWCLRAIYGGCLALFMRVLCCLWEMCGVWAVYGVFQRCMWTLCGVCERCVCVCVCGVCWLRVVSVGDVYGLCIVSVDGVWCLWTVYVISALCMVFVGDLWCLWTFKWSMSSLYSVWEVCGVWVVYGVCEWCVVVVRVCPYEPFMVYVGGMWSWCVYVCVCVWAFYGVCGL